VQAPLDFLSRSGAGATCDLVYHFVVTPPFEPRCCRRQRLAEIGRPVAAGKVVIPIGKRVSLAEADDAQKLAQGGVRGKAILTVW
jgi:NADPH:quinone reductase-like Zn-dependent oxidoreductase